MNEERGVNEAKKDGGRRGVGASRGGEGGRGEAKKQSRLERGKKNSDETKKKAAAAAASFSLFDSVVLF